jgi:hypothetical protein
VLVVVQQATPLLGVVALEAAGEALEQRVLVGEAVDQLDVAIGSYQQGCSAIRCRG